MTSWVRPTPTWSLRCDGTEGRTRRDFVELANKTLLLVGQDLEYDTLGQSITMGLMICIVFSIATRIVCSRTRLKKWSQCISLAIINGSVTFLWLIIGPIITLRIPRALEAAQANLEIANQLSNLESCSDTFFTEAIIGF